jgi:hypothetical protein
LRGSGLLLLLRLRLLLLLQLFAFLGVPHNDIQRPGCGRGARIATGAGDDEAGRSGGSGGGGCRALWRERRRQPAFHR